MSLESIINSSKEIFKIDKETINFKIDNKHSSSDLTAIDKQEINITNLTSKYLALQTKTTKKKIYGVNPPYCIIPPNGAKSIKIIFYNVQGEVIDSKKHKFKFEGFTILENEKDKDAKNLFNEYIQKGNKIEGNILKRNVQFIYEKKEENKNEQKDEKQEKENILGETLESLSKEVIQTKKEEKNLDKEKKLETDKKIEIKGNNKNKSQYLIIGGIFISLIIIAFYLLK